MQCIIQNMGKTPVNNQYKNSFILDSTYWAVSLIVLSGKTKHLFSFNKNFVVMWQSLKQKMNEDCVLFCSGVSLSGSVSSGISQRAKSWRRSGHGELSASAMSTRTCISSVSVWVCGERDSLREEDPSGGASVETAHLTVQKTAFRQRLGAEITGHRPSRGGEIIGLKTLPPVEYVH